jgi:hypothetical protein
MKIMQRACQSVSLQVVGFKRAKRMASGLSCPYTGNANLDALGPTSQVELSLDVCKAGSSFVNAGWKCW